MKNKKHLYLISIIAIAVPFIGALELIAEEIRTTTTVFDGGGRTTKNYISSINVGGHKTKKGGFPIVTHQLSVGRVDESEANNINLTAAFRPLFIVGYDAVSIGWLSDNADLLIEKKALGYVANVKNKLEMDYLSNLLQNKIMLLPMNMDEMARELNLKHYPFYVDSDGVLR